MLRTTFIDIAWSIGRVRARHFGRYCAFLFALAFLLAAPGATAVDVFGVVSDASSQELAACAAVFQRRNSSHRLTLRTVPQVESPRRRELDELVARADAVVQGVGHYLTEVQERFAFGLHVFGKEWEPAAVERTPRSRWGGQTANVRQQPARRRLNARQRPRKAKAKGMEHD